MARRLSLRNPNGYDGSRATNSKEGITRFATPADIAANANNVAVTPAALAAGTPTFRQIRIDGGAATDFIGTATLVAGTVTIANTNIADTDQIYIQRKAVNASTTLGETVYTITPATSFTINSAILGTPGSIQTADLSTVTYNIIRQV